MIDTKPVFCKYYESDGKTVIMENSKHSGWSSLLLLCARQTSLIKSLGWDWMNGVRQEKEDGYGNSLGMNGRNANGHNTI